MKNLSCNERNYGIDLLKIVSMFFVVVLHTMTQGALINLPKLTLNYEAGFFMEALTYCCVNCFALASGYVGVNSGFKYRRIVPRWIQVVFYCVLITLFFKYIKPDLASPGPIKDAFMPVTKVTYWYFTGYFALFFLSPFINRAFRDISRKQAAEFIASVIFVYIFIPYFAKKDLYSLALGYSAIWIIILYAVGAALKGLRLEGAKRSWIFLFAYIVFAAAAWGVECLSEFRSVADGGEFIANNTAVTYTSIYIFLSSAALVLYFANMDISSKKAIFVIRNLAEASFGVYIIHTHPLLFHLPYWNRLSVIGSYPLPRMVLSIIVHALAVFAVCIFADLIRIRLFRLVKLNKAVDVVADAVSAKIVPTVRKIMK